MYISTLRKKHQFFVGCTLFFTLCVSATVSSFAQSDYPDTDIWLLDVQRSDSGYTFSGAENITDKTGYDNQPAFAPDGSYLLYSAIRDNKQADIYKYDCSTKKSTRLSNTPESEFAPTFMPGGKFYTVIRVDAKKEQRVWKSAVDQGNFSIVTDRLDSIGYHIWWDDHTLMLRYIDQKHFLQTVNMLNGRERWVSTISGRCLQLLPSEASVCFVEKTNDTTWGIFKVNEYYEIRSVIPTLPKCEDFLVTPRSSYWMADGTKLYEFDPARDTTWRLIADFAQFGIKGFYRMAINASGDRLAIVSYKGKKP